MFAFRMQLKELFALFSMMSLNVPLAPTGEEMESRFENEQKLKLDLFENYDGTMFPKLTRPLMVQPMMTIDHIRSINEEQGAMTISMTLYFIWTDSRLQWNRTEYGGIKAFAKNHYENMAWNIWSPTIFITELPGVNTQTDLFLNHDVDFLVHYTGSVTATIKVLINTPCLLSFGDYPNDYQNCSLTLMTPYTANVLQFDALGDAHLSYFIKNRDQITDVEDFELTEIFFYSFYIYLGFKLVDFMEIGGYRLSMCRHYFRYTLSLKRINKLVFAQLSMPMIVICMFIALSGAIPRHSSLTILVFSVGFQLFNMVNMAEIVPDDYNGMPTIVALAIFMMFETILLISWKVFAIHVLGKENFDEAEVLPTQTDELREFKYFEIVKYLDQILKIVLLCQFVVNFCIIWVN